MTFQKIKSSKLNEGWLKERFGDCVSQISVESTLRLKSSIKDVFRAVHGSVPQHIEALCKQLPTPPQGIPDKDFIFGYEANGSRVPGLLETDFNLLQFSLDYPSEWAQVKELIGLTRQRSVHASAFLISEEPIHDFIPLTTINKVKVTQFNAPGVEAMGGLKMDFLVVNCLNDIQDCIRMVQDRHGKSVDWSLSRKKQDVAPSMIIDGKKVPLLRVVPFKDKFLDIWSLPEDLDVFNDICEGDTESVFQLNTELAKSWLPHFNFEINNNGIVTKGLKSIYDLSVFTALDRPGPLDAGIVGENGKKHNMLVEYANRLKGKFSTEANEFLNKFLPETKGIIVFQEQLEKVYKELSGGTAAQAENFRRLVAKKETIKVLKLKEEFMPKATERIGSALAEEVWSQLITFGQYGFNASHAVCYVTMSYACAFLKHYYPLEWWTAVLQNAKKRTEIDEKFWPYCGHLIDPPNVKNVTSSFSISGSRIQAPISLLEGIGDKAQQQLVKYAPYNDIQDFCEKIFKYKTDNAVIVEKVKEDKATGIETKVKTLKLATTALNSKVISTLIIAGAMDELFPATQKYEVDGKEMELEVTTVDKLKMYQDAFEKAGNKKLPAKKKQEIIDKFRDLDEIQQYQLKKQILPSFFIDLLWPCVRLEPDKIVKESDGYYYGVGKKAIRIYEGRFLKALNAAGEQKVMPPGGIEAAFIGYILSERRFSYEKNGQKNEALAMIIDICGQRKELVQWPGSDGKLHADFKNSMKGSVVVASLRKKEDKVVRLNKMFVIRKPISLDVEES